MSSEGTTVSFERRGVQAEWEALQSGILGRLWTPCGMGRLEHEDWGRKGCGGQEPAQSHIQAGPQGQSGANTHQAGVTRLILRCG